MLYGFLSLVFCMAIGGTLIAWFESERIWTWAPGPFLPRHSERSDR